MKSADQRQKNQIRNDSTQSIGNGEALTAPRSREDATQAVAGEEQTPSNEYVLNVAFFSFLIFMITQAFFAIIAKSQSMLADSLAMSVDAFTYLFNLAAERLKHRSRDHYNHRLSAEENKRRKKMIRLYLEFVPPMMSVTALIVVSVQAFMEAMETIMDSQVEMNGRDTDESHVLQLQEQEEDEPNVRLMLFFSSLNLGLDILNVTCFSKVQNFSLMSVGDLIAGQNQKDENDDVRGRQELIALCSSKHEDEEEGSKGRNYEDRGTIAQSKEPSPSKRRYEFPPSIIVDTSIDSSYESSSHKDASDVSGEDAGLLGISMPNYGSHQGSDYEWWGEEFSLDAVYGGGGSQSDGWTSSAASVETAESLGSGTASNSHQSRRSKAIEIGFADELDGISEGDENDESDDHEDGSVTNNGDHICENDDNDSELSGRGFNLNMCSAYTHVMADTMRSIAVLIAAATSFFLDLSPALADATAAIIVSIIIAVSLGPLIVGLMKTFHEIQLLRRESRADV